MEKKQQKHTARKMVVCDIIQGCCRRWDNGVGEVIVKGVNKFGRY